MPPLLAAMQTIAPMDSAMTLWSMPVQPTTTKIRHVIRSVATVIPEIGFDEEPISPVILEETVTKKKPKTIIKIADKKLT